MTTADILVLTGGTGIIIFILWFFFGPEGKGKVAQVEDKQQKLTIVVEGGYSPAEVVVKKGIPVEITFDRRESGECSEWVVFQVKTKEQKNQKTKELKARLKPFAKTTLEFTPEEIGEFPFVCGMGMLHGKLIVRD